MGFAAVWLVGGLRAAQSVLLLPAVQSRESAWDCSQRFVGLTTGS